MPMKRASNGAKRTAAAKATTSKTVQVGGLPTKKSPLTAATKTVASNTAKKSAGQKASPKKATAKAMPKSASKQKAPAGKGQVQRATNVSALTRGAKKR
jgi:hypothetical protein